jgi:hypothetical protein
MHRSALLLLLVASCATTDTLPILTQPERLQFLTSKVNESLTSQMSCPNAKLTFLSTATSADAAGSIYVDLYAAEGCSQRTDFQTMVRTIGDGFHTTSTAVLVPTLDNYRAEAHAQLAKTAAFDVGCNTISYVSLSETAGPLHTGYDATTGAEGCGKKLTYRTHCSENGYSAGKHQISCKSSQDLASTLSN